jgi:hypothetical protein
MLKARRYPERQKGISRFGLAHPIALALLSGALLGSWAYLIVGDWRATAGVTVGFTALMWFLWGRWGPARRREQRLYDDDGRLRGPTDPASQ